MKRAFLLLILIIGISPAIYAGGYQVGLHGQKQIGMGLIGTSLNLDASAGFYNPAGLSLMPHRYSVLAGASGIMSSTAFRLPEPSDYQARTDNPLGTPFYLYAAGQIAGGLSAGIAVNTPFGNGLAWDDQWAGRYLIQEISMSTITIQPTLSYRFGESFSVGAGFVYAIGSVDMRRALPVQGPQGEGMVSINGSTTGMGFNAGMMYAGQQGLNIGLSYRSRIDMNVDDAMAEFSVPASLSLMFPQQNEVAVSLPLPANLDFGVSFQLNPQLMLGLALNYVFWSAYDTLAFDFAINTPALADSRNPRMYSDRLIVRLGGQYQVNESLYVRAGTYYDPSPANEQYFSPETPSLHNLAFTTGLSILPVSGLSIDISLLYIMGLQADRTYSPDNFAGTYKSRALIPGIGISFNL